ncbi:hypothetical protein DFJ73DRAFT_832572, partial [Zopfochytrium polystomum]
MIFFRTIRSLVGGTQREQEEPPTSQAQRLATSGDCQCDDSRTGSFYHLDSDADRLDLAVDAAFFGIDLTSTSRHQCPSRIHLSGSAEGNLACRTIRRNPSRLSLKIPHDREPAPPVGEIQFPDSAISMKTVSSYDRLPPSRQSSTHLSSVASSENLTDRTSVHGRSRPRPRRRCGSCRERTPTDRSEDGKSHRVDDLAASEVSCDAPWTPSLRQRTASTPTILPSWSEAADAGFDNFEPSLDGQKDSAASHSGVRESAGSLAALEYVARCAYMDPPAGIVALECCADVNGEGAARETPQRLRRGRNLALRCPSLLGPDAVFTPTRWLQNNHLQSAFVQVLKGAPPFVTYDRELVHLSDGNTLALDWCPSVPQDPDDPTPIIFMIHGLNGGSSEYYIRSFIDVCRAKRNFRCVLSPTVRQRRAVRAKIVGVGWSLGANVLVNVNFAAGLAFGCLFDVNKCVDMLSIYNGALTVGVQMYLHRQSLQKDKRLDLARIFQPMGARDLVEQVFCPIYGQNDPREYLRQGSCGEPGPHLSSPRDDPITKPDWAPLAEIAENPNVVFVTTREGGHLGCWANRACLEWIDCVLN